MTKVELTNILFDILSIDKNPFSKKSFKYLIPFIKKFSSYLDKYTPTISERTYFILNGLKERPICKKCGLPVKYLTSGVYREFCSKKCMNSSDIIKQKRKETFVKNTGYENNFQNPKILEKAIKNSCTKENIAQRKQTYFEKTGYDHQLKNPEVIEQIKNTNMEKYGVENVYQADWCIKQIKQTKLERYGNENYNNIEKAKETCMEKYGVENVYQADWCIEKSKDTKFLKYGNPNYNNIEKSKLTNLERYDVTNPMHIGEVADRCSNGYKNSWHEYTLPSGKIIKLQGFEPKAFDLLLEEYTEDEILYKRSDMPKLIYYTLQDNKDHRYYPDFYIPKDNLLVEVKSTYTYEASLEVNLLKEQCVINYGFKYRLIIL